jgi:hypothetical protein
MEHPKPQLKFFSNHSNEAHQLKKELEEVGYEVHEVLTAGTICVVYCGFSIFGEWDIRERFDL